jgi:hypothetical protein
LVVQRYLDAMRLPEFSDNAPHVVMEHLVLSGSNVVAGSRPQPEPPDTSYVFDTP